MGTLVFLHGVGGLRPGWADGLLAHLCRVATDVNVVAPSYVDLLTGVPEPAEPAEQREPGADGPADLGAAPSDRQAAYRAAYVRRQEALAAALAAASDALPPGMSWPAGLPRPGLLPDRLPLPRVLRTPLLGLDQVGRYLDDPGRRDVVLRRVRAALAPVRGPITLVGHSLGSLVALDLLADPGREVSLLVTLGSPLGHAAVADRVAAPSIPYERLGGWVNVVHLLDPVPFGRGLRDRFPAALDVYLPVLSGVSGVGGLVRGVGRAATAHLDTTYLESDTVRTAIARGLAGIPVAV